MKIYGKVSSHECMAIFSCERGVPVTLVKNVLIVGGGIAGMCAAIELRKRGVEVDLLEADPQWRVYGAGITISAPSLRAFQRVGVLETILQRGEASEGFDLFLANGTPLGPIPGLTAAGSSISASVGILRPTLARVLSDATVAAGTRVRLGTTFAEASLTDGTMRPYDLIIGADGIQSKVRAALFSDAPKPRYTGQVCWRAVVPRPASLQRAEMYIGGKIKAGLVPVSKDEMYLFFLEARATPDHIDASHWPELLRRTLAEFSEPIATIRESLGPESRIVYRPLFALMMPKPWHRDNTVLIGDAAHATTPHLASGAGLAVEDALVLAEELERAPSLEDALHRFTTRRYDRCRLVVDNSVRLGDMERDGESPQVYETLMRASTAALAAAI